MVRKPPRAGWFYAGLFLTTLSTLSLELLNTRLLSVVAWYHLAFFAVSTAMFGMSAGAIHVYLRGDASGVWSDVRQRRPEEAPNTQTGDEQARQTLYRSALRLAVAI